MEKAREQNKVQTRVRGERREKVGDQRRRNKRKGKKKKRGKVSDWRDEETLGLD
jgi:hypothetical protein